MNNYDINEYSIFYGLCKFYLLMMITLCFLYMWTMYTQYKNAHDKWYDINRENQLSPRKERTH